ncbi:MAG: hypothetical protein ABI444_03355 [Candidatus Kapaibacterium sp.]
MGKSIEGLLVHGNNLESGAGKVSTNLHRKLLTAQQLDIATTTLYRKLKQYGIE